MYIELKVVSLPRNPTLCEIISTYTIVGRAPPILSFYY